MFQNIIQEGKNQVKAQYAENSDEHPGSGVTYDPRYLMPRKIRLSLQQSFRFPHLVLLPANPHSSLSSPLGFQR